METPSDRVLASWRKHAREGWGVESYKHFPQRIITPMMTDEEAKRFESAFCADVRRFTEGWSAW
jgi:hypothetical protein